MLRSPCLRQRSHQNLLTTVPQQGLVHLLSPNLHSINSAGLSQLPSPDLRDDLSTPIKSLPSRSAETLSCGSPALNSAPGQAIPFQWLPPPGPDALRARPWRTCTHRSHARPLGPRPLLPRPTSTCRAGLSDSRFKTFFLCSLRRPSIFRMGGRYSSSARPGGGVRGAEAPPCGGRGGAQRRSGGTSFPRPRLTVGVLQGLDHVWVECCAHQHLHVAPVHLPHRPGLQQTPGDCPLWGRGGRRMGHELMIPTSSEAAWVADNVLSTRAGEKSLFSGSSSPLETNASQPSML